MLIKIVMLSYNNQNHLEISNQLQFMLSSFIKLNNQMTVKMTILAQIRTEAVFTTRFVLWLSEVKWKWRRRDEAEISSTKIRCNINLKLSSKLRSWQNNYKWKRCKRRGALNIWKAVRKDRFKKSKNKAPIDVRIRVRIIMLEYLRVHETNQLKALQEVYYHLDRR